MLLGGLPRGRGTFSGADGSRGLGGRPRGRRGPSDEDLRGPASPGRRGFGGRPRPRLTGGREYRSSVKVSSPDANIPARWEERREAWSAGRQDDRVVSMWAEMAAFVDPMVPLVLATAALINWNKNTEDGYTLVFASLNKKILEEGFHMF